MDLSTLIGIVLGFVIIVVSITMDDIKAINNFINMPSLFIVVGGTIMAIVASYPFSILKNIPSHMRIPVSYTHLNRLLLPILKYDQSHG